MAIQEQKTVAVELCRSNSIGSRYYQPSVIELHEVTREEADRLLAEVCPNGFFWREQKDTTGAGY
jgi:hypothetical protein